MRYSQLHVKTNKSAKDFDSINATYLQKAGFIYQIMAGSYAFLPLGLRVLNKIEKVVREEMDKIGTEIFMPSLAPKTLWEKTGRIEYVDVLMKTSGANAASLNKSTNEYILNSTHEELVTPIAQSFNLSYKDFPFALYQIQTKFRNEARAKSGLLRGREFRMKDLYSFHTSEEDLKRYYELAKQAYWNVYNRLGIGEETVIALASGGDFTKDYSHEFQTRVATGEDTLFRVPSTGVVYNREVTPSKARQINDSSEEIKEMQEVEGIGIIGVEDLAKYLKISVEKTTKTIIFTDENKRVIAAAVRGDYEIDEEKLKKVLGVEKLFLASTEVVKQATGAEVGYAGILNLSDEVVVIIDESVIGRKNFECGANKTNYHTINVNFGRDLPEPEKVYDIKVAKEGDLFPETGEEYEVFKACEVGNIFPLNTKFAKAFDYYFTDEKGEKQIVYMGCYGIGTSRIPGVIAEKYNDDKGLLWPAPVAPFQVYLIGLDLQDQEIKAKAESIYSQLTNAGVEVLFDDRVETRAGEKFADADLIGIPWRVVVSKRTGENVEVKARTEQESKLISINDLLALLDR